LRERKINPQPTGACGCCQMRAFVDAKGILSIVYRSAGENVNRDTTLLVSTDKTASFKAVTLEKWKVAACPMSSFALAESEAGAYAAWETEGRVSFAAVNRASAQAGKTTVAAGQTEPCKHPALAVDGNGNVLLAWTEGTGWNKGGSVAWQVFDAQGRLTDVKGRAGNLPVWDLPSAVSTPDGFVLIY
jgi:hypothetical protein